MVAGRSTLALAAALFAALSLLACAGTRDAAPAAPPVERVLPESAYLALAPYALDDDGPACAGSDERCVTGVGPGAIHADGSIAFWGMSGKQPQLYRVDAAGTVVALGRRGSGPGEYAMPQPIGFTVSGDVHLADFMQRRLTRYGADGKVLSTQPFPIHPAMFHPGLARGTPVVLATEMPREQGDSLPVSLFALDADARSPRLLHPLPLRRPAYGFADMRPVPPSHASQERFVFEPHGSMLLTQGDRFLVDRFDSTGSPVLRFGFDVLPREVSKADIAESNRRMLRGVTEPRMRAALEQSLESSAASARHPAITGLVVALDGSIWVRESPAERSDSVQWVVLEHTGEPRGRIKLATGDVVIGGRDGRVLLARDEDSAADSAGLRWSRLRPR